MTPPTRWASSRITKIAGKRLRVKARFGRSARADEIFRDVADGIRVNTSVGYVIHNLERVGVDQATGAEIYRVTDWEPFEGSLVAVPADPTVGVGRSTPTTTFARHSMEKEERTPAAGTVEAERTRVQDLLACGEEYQNLRWP
jgi:plasmid stability protein